MFWLFAISLTGARQVNLSDNPTNQNEPTNQPTNQPTTQPTNHNQLQPILTLTMNDVTENMNDETETEPEPSDGQVDNQSRIQQEPGGHLVDDFSMMLNQQNNPFAGNSGFTGSPINVNGSRSVKSSDVSDSSSVASTPTVVRSKLEEPDLTGGQMLTFADIIAESFVCANQKAHHRLSNAPQINHI